MNEKDTSQKNKEVDGNKKKRKREEETQEKSKRSKVSESPSKQTFEKNKGKIYQKKDDEKLAEVFEKDMIPFFEKLEEVAKVKMN